jgi:H/ACA ribonucleoprotein complex subunit 4
VVAWTKKILNAEKAGHSGTLDPPATGLLPIGLGEATKALSVLLLGAKEYIALARLHGDEDEKKIQKVLSEFQGEIYQRPPQRSSVKRQTRTRQIYQLNLLERRGNLLLLDVLCQAGTYIRKLIYDVGEVLACGASMVELRRIRVSHFSQQDGFVRLHDLLAASEEWKKGGDESTLRSMLRSVEDVTSSLKQMTIRDSAVDAVCHGAQLAIPGILRASPNITKGDLIAIYSAKKELVALAESTMNTQEISESTRGIAALTKRVIMKAGTYPKMWKSHGGEEKQVQS